jgi:hypothetical protein
MKERENNNIVEFNRAKSFSSYVKSEMGIKEPKKSAPKPKETPAKKGKK